MDIVKFLIGALVIGYVFYQVASGFRKGLSGKIDTFHCMDCGTDGPPKQATKGTFIIEIVLWVCFLIPGLIYSAWRVSTRYNSCSTCGSSKIVPADSPAAVAHRKQLAV